jgi:hypothetical protein
VSARPLYPTIRTYHTANREASGIGADGTDPIKHASGMFLRWDPAHETATQGREAWAALLKEYGALPGMDATGTAVGDDLDNV